MRINKRILTSALTIGTAGALLVGATFAFFTDSGSSNNNEFRSGILDLHVADNNEGFGDNVSTSFQTPSNWAPGDKYVDFVCFKNNGSVPIQQVLFNLTSPDAGSTNLDNFIYVSNIELGPVGAGQCNSAGAVGTESLTNFITLFNSRFGTNAPLSSLLTLIDGTNQIDDDLIDGSANVLNTGDMLKFRVEWTFDSTATSAVAGQSVHVNLGFSATQNEVE